MVCLWDAQGYLTCDVPTQNQHTIEHFAAASSSVVLPPIPKLNFVPGSSKLIKSRDPHDMNKYSDTHTNRMINRLILAKFRYDAGDFDGAVQAVKMDFKRRDYINDLDDRKAEVVNYYNAFIALPEIKPYNLRAAMMYYSLAPRASSPGRSMPRAMASYYKSTAPRASSPGKSMPPAMASFYKSTAPRASSPGRSMPATMASFYKSTAPTALSQGSFLASMRK